MERLSIYKNRTSVGLLLVPVATSLIYSLLPGSGDAVLLALVSCFVSLIIWIPVLLYCTRRNWTRFPQLLAAGTATGLSLGMIGFVVMLVIGRPGTSQELLFGFGIFTIGPLIYGAVVSSIFWAIAFAGRK